MISLPHTASLNDVLAVRWTVAYVTNVSSSFHLCLCILQRNSCGSLAQYVTSPSLSLSRCTGYTLLAPCRPVHGLPSQSEEILNPHTFYGLTPLNHGALFTADTPLRKPGSLPPASSIISNMCSRSSLPGRWLNRIELLD